MNDKKIVGRLSRVMELIDEERTKDTDKESDVDFMNAIIGELELRAQTVEEEIDELDGDMDEEVELEDDEDDGDNPDDSWKD